MSVINNFFILDDKKHPLLSIKHFSVIFILSCIFYIAITFLFIDKIKTNECNIQQNREMTQMLSLTQSAMATDIEKGGIKMETYKNVRKNN